MVFEEISLSTPNGMDLVQHSSVPGALGSPQKGIVQPTPHPKGSSSFDSLSRVVKNKSIFFFPKRPSSMFFQMVRKKFRPKIRFKKLVFDIAQRPQSFLKIEFIWLRHHNFLKFKFSEVCIISIYSNALTYNKKGDNALCSKYII